MRYRYNKAHNPEVANSEGDSIKTGSDKIQKVPARRLREYHVVDYNVTENCYRTKTDDEIARNTLVFFLIDEADERPRNSDDDRHHSKICAEKEVGKGEDDITYHLRY